MPLRQVRKEFSPCFLKEMKFCFESIHVIGCTSLLLNISWKVKMSFFSLYKLGIEVGNIGKKAKKIITYNYLKLQIFPTFY